MHRDLNTTTPAAPVPDFTDVVVVGGTLTAWIAAAKLAAAFRAAVRVTVLETPYRPSEQVTTLPPTTQRDLFDPLGIPEATWMRACDATFDVAVKYVDPAAPERDFYVPRNTALPDCEGFSPLDAWLLLRASGETVESADRACFREPPLMDAMKSPRWLDGRAALSYGWHADTIMLTHFLRRTAVREFGVRLVTGGLLGADRAPDGALTTLRTTRGPLTADLFLDCTDEARLLLSATLREPLTPAPLLPTHTVTATVTAPTHDGAAPRRTPAPTGARAATGTFAPYTTLTALPEGWAWRRPLLDRHCVGLAYDGTRTTADEAARALLAPLAPHPRQPHRADAHRADALGPDAHGPTPRTVHTVHRPGRPRRAWVHHCVALGRAAGSTDPLTDDHATTLDLLDQLIRDFPSPGGHPHPPAAAARFDRAVAAHHARALDLALIRLHHPERPDLLPLSDAARAALEAHRAGLPVTPDDLPVRTLLTALASLTPRPATATPPTTAVAHHHRALRAAEEHFRRVKRHQHTLLETLPTAHTYLTRLHATPLTPTAATAAAALTA
ncbi:tryptophan 7-halogenase [Streptomyces antimicrobicus]|uniref:Tryptophan 7-halogenase n=1 Tax=Streptomyces antimicrobicus TaxID=2883108 RepID=A0ABS8BCH8_9ACTN|nr:tryptophan 7-halogenase [Streptomyces antimicrobicus]MCB5182327.1 tryptophan 7-halogenase [Streptomyces antimicrobicus]